MLADSLSQEIKPNWMLECQKQRLILAEKVTFLTFWFFSLKIIFFSFFFFFFLNFITLLNLLRLKHIFFRISGTESVDFYLSHVSASSVWENTCADERPTSKMWVWGKKKGGADIWDGVRKGGGASRKSCGECFCLLCVCAGSRCVPSGQHGHLVCTQ